MGIFYRFLGAIAGGFDFGIFVIQALLKEGEFLGPGFLIFDVVLCDFVFGEVQGNDVEEEFVVCELREVVDLNFKLIPHHFKFGKLLSRGGEHFLLGHTKRAFVARIEVGDAVFLDQFGEFDAIFSNEIALIEELLVESGDGAFRSVYFGFLASGDVGVGDSGGDFYCFFFGVSAGNDFNEVGAFDSFSGDLFAENGNGFVGDGEFFGVFGLEEIDGSAEGFLSVDRFKFTPCVVYGESLAGVFRGIKRVEGDEAGVDLNGGGGLVLGEGGEGEKEKKSDEGFHDWRVVVFCFGPKGKFGLSRLVTL